MAAIRTLGALVDACVEAAAARSSVAALSRQLVGEHPVSLGDAQATVRLTRRYAGGSDPRQDGMAVRR